MNFDPNIHFNPKTYFDPKINFDPKTDFDPKNGFYNKKNTWKLGRMDFIKQNIKKWISVSFVCKIQVTLFTELLLAPS